MNYEEWLKWRKRYFKKEKRMSKKNWKDLFIGLSIIIMSTFLFFNGQYTIEIAILIGILTLWWLEFF
tara:strand:- start:206 stop:406 length:201 start_codon:yes stop_codon:yes gene_type:complete